MRTLLNSGNVVFTAPGADPSDTAARIQEALATRLGVSARVTVLTAADLATAVSDNPLLDVADNPSRLLVAVLANPADRRRPEAIGRLLGDAVTTRNWATITKLHTLAGR